MVITSISDQERRNMRREQVERYLESGMTVPQWCKLNGVGESTLYTWLNRFRGEEPELFGGRPSNTDNRRWTEVKREELAASVALAPPPAPATLAAPASQPESSCRACDVPPPPSHPEPGRPRIAVLSGPFRVEIPPGCAEADIAAVLGAIARAS